MTMNTRPASVRLDLAQPKVLERGALDGHRAEKIAADYMDVATRDNQTRVQDADIRLPAPSALDGQSVYAWHRHASDAHFNRLKAKYTGMASIAANAQMLVDKAFKEVGSPDLAAHCGVKTGVLGQTSSAQLFHDKILAALNDAHRDSAEVNQSLVRLTAAAPALGVKSDGTLNDAFQWPKLRASSEPVGGKIEQAPFLRVPNGFGAAPTYYYIRTDRQLEGHRDAAVASFKSLTELRYVYIEPALRALKRAHADIDLVFEAQQLARFQL